MEHETMAFSVSIGNFVFIYFLIFLLIVFIAKTAGEAEDNIEILDEKLKDHENRLETLFWLTENPPKYKNNTKFLKYKIIALEFVNSQQVELVIQGFNIDKPYTPKLKHCHTYVYTLVDKDGLEFKIIEEELIKLEANPTTK